MCLCPSFQSRRQTKSSHIFFWLPTGNSIKLLISGVLVLSLPIPIIAGNFEDFHRMQQTKTKAEKAKKKLTEAKANEEAERVAFCKAEVTMKTNSDNVSTEQIDQKWQD